MANSTLSADTVLTFARVPTGDTRPLQRRIFHAFIEMARRPVASGALLR